jgi:hypothetical protein
MTVNLAIDVMHGLSDGYGVEDIAVQHGHPLDDCRAAVRHLRKIGWLHRRYMHSPMKPARVGHRIGGYVPADVRGVTAPNAPQGDPPCLTPSGSSDGPEGFFDR